MNASPALARIKARGVRPAIAASGGIDGAAATAERGRSVVGDWNNLNHDAFPPLDCAHALDEVAMAVTGKTPILQAQAAELGCVVIRLPEAHGDCAALAMGLIEATGEFGDIAHAITEGLRDSRMTPAERDGAVAQIDEAVASLVRLRVLVLNAVDAVTPIDRRAFGGMH